MQQIKMLVASCSRLVARGRWETLTEENNFILKETSTSEGGILQAREERPDIILLCYQFLLADVEDIDKGVRTEAKKALGKIR